MTETILCMLGCFYFVMSELNKISKMLEDLESLAKSKTLRIKPSKIDATYTDGMQYEVEE